MKIEYNHNLGKEEAYNRINNLLNKLQDQYKDMISDPQKTWNSTKDEMDFIVNIKGYHLSGKVYIKDKQIVLEGKLPFVARMFSGKIKGIIKEKLETLLA